MAPNGAVFIIDVSRLCLLVTSGGVLGKTTNTTTVSIKDGNETLYIEGCTDYSVPPRKLRWRDHRNMAMHGDDVIGKSERTHHTFETHRQQTAKAPSRISAWGFCYKKRR